MEAKYGKRSTGRPRKNINDVYVEDAEEKQDRSGVTIDNIEGMAADHKSLEYGDI